jgi:hypothetical protein
MRRAGLAAVLACGCASYSAARAAPPATATASISPAPSYTREPPASLSGGATNAPSSLRFAPVAPNGSAQGLDVPGEPDDAGREGSIARWEAELQRGRDELAASVGQCRVICMAATHVCTATREICRITGDLIAAQPRDVRCARARSACIDAGRRRDGACPVCPG